ncbi:MAG: SMI1/KNR4 family protein [Polyangiales bacterium]
MTRAREVFARWSAVGIQRDDVDEMRDREAAFERLERHRGVTLPDAFRALWSLSDGTASADDDELTFWPLDNVEDDPSVSAACPAPRLAFADWRLGAVVFCLEFEGGRAAGVTAHAAGEVRVVAATFEGFLEGYLDDPRGLVAGRAGYEI